MVELRRIKGKKRKDLIDNIVADLRLYFINQFGKGRRGFRGADDELVERNIIRRDERKETILAIVKKRKYIEEVYYDDVAGIQRLLDRLDTEIMQRIRDPDSPDYLNFLLHIPFKGYAVISTKEEGGEEDANYVLNYREALLHKQQLNMVHRDASVREFLSTEERNMLTGKKDKPGPEVA